MHRTLTRALILFRVVERLPRYASFAHSVLVSVAFGNKYAASSCLS